MSDDPNIDTVELAATALGNLTEELILVGGCAVGLLLTDPARTSIRQTIDVDLVTAVTPRIDYYALCDRLRACGFCEQPSEEVICRWAKGSLLLDVMPADESILGFTNSWYAPAARSAVPHVLPSGRRIQLITPPYFLATKLEAFAGRGKGDYLHHDMEDIITIVDGRESIAAEVLAADGEVRDYLRTEFESLLADPSFSDRLPWLLNPHEIEARQPVVLERMRRIAEMW